MPHINPAKEAALPYHLANEFLEYNPDTGVFTWKQARGNKAVAGRQAGSLDDVGYIVVGVKGNRYQAHRLAWLLMTGAWPLGDVSHRNLVRNDNRWPNLALAAT